MANTKEIFALVVELRNAVKDHHTGTDTLRPFTQTYERDEALLEKSQRIMSEINESYTNKHQE